MAHKEYDKWVFIVIIDDIVIILIFSILTIYFKFSWKITNEHCEVFIYVPKICER
jgi:hypothetical protein